MLAAIGVFAVGCESQRADRLDAPRTLVSPYLESQGEVLIAVVPLRNDSATSVIDAPDVSDKLVAAVEEVRGFRCLPLNRTIATMRALEMQAVRTPAEARRLAQALKVDGVLVGAITDWDPYTPTIGIQLALYGQPDLVGRQSATLDPRTLSASFADPQTAPGPNGRRLDDPIAVISEHLDGKNNQVQMDVRTFAEGRLKGPGALGWRRYLASMPLYSEFAAYHAVDELLKAQWVRTAQAAHAHARAEESPSAGHPEKEP
jgi:hypothetical protein